MNLSLWLSSMTADTNLFICITQPSSIHLPLQSEISSHISPCPKPSIPSPLIDLTIKRLTGDQIRNIIVVIILRLFLLIPTHTHLLPLHLLIALGKLAQRREAVRAQLVKNTRDEFRELFLLAVAVDCEGVGGDGGMN